MSVPERLDHVVIAGPDLGEVVDEVERLTGVRAAQGGRHPTGTANALIAFTQGGQRTRSYLELIGPDTESGFEAARVPTFGIDRLRGPRVVTYAIHPDDLDATVSTARGAGFDPGEISPLSRRTVDGRLLEWRLVLSERSGRAAPEHAAPFLIDWGETAHPTSDDLPTLEIVALRRRTPNVDAEAAALHALGEPVAGPGSTELALATEATFELLVAGTAGLVALR